MRADPLICKLEQFTKKFSDSEKRLIEDAISDIVDYAPRQDIISQGDRPEHVHLLLEGWAGRYKLLPEGERQIMAYLIPGDLCDVHVALLRQMDHSIGALSACKVAFIPDKAITKMTDDHGRLSKALWWSTLVDEAISREWLVTVARRQADKRVSHLFCEMLLRSKAVGLSTDNSFELPLTQEELGDTMGLSGVHMNRTLQKLRSDGLITSQGKRLVINDLARLMEFADFDPMYLHQISAGAKSG
jgi:CRP-like cAMP-binding protein